MSPELWLAFAGGFGWGLATYGFMLWTLRRSRQPTVDEAWGEAEALLTEGWRLSGLDRDADRWIAFAERTESPPWGDHIPGSPGTEAFGPTPAAALQALAVKLRATRP